MVPLDSRRPANTPRPLPPPRSLSFSSRSGMPLPPSTEIWVALVTRTSFIPEITMPSGLTMLRFSSSGDTLQQKKGERFHFSKLQTSDEWFVGTATLVPKRTLTSTSISTHFHRDSSRPTAIVKTTSVVVSYQIMTGTNVTNVTNGTILLSAVPFVTRSLSH